MRRFLPAAVIALLGAAVATPAHAGYLIIRVILEGSAGGGVEPGSGYGGYGEGGSPGPGEGSSGAGGYNPGGYNPGGYGGSQPPRPMGSSGGGGGILGLGGLGGGMTPPAGPVVHDPSRSVVIIVPITTDLSNKLTPFYAKIPQHPTTNPLWPTKVRTTHRGQDLHTNLFTDSSTIQWYENLLTIPAPRKTRAMEVHDQYDKWKRSTKSDPKQLYNVLTAALDAGLADDALAYAEELYAALAAKKDALPPDLAGFARAYGAMQKGIKGAATKANPAAEEWKAKLDATNLTPGPHYILVSWDATQDEVKRRLGLLEENFKGFFLWHAARGVELPVPEAPLVAVLPKTAKEVIRLAPVLDIPTRMAADGFYSPDRDVLVLSPERLDDVGLTFSVQTRQMYRDLGPRSALLEGFGPKLDVNGQNGKRPEEVARAQTVALVERLVEDAAATNAVSREGTRQLLYATGRFTRHVDLPEWVAHGAVNAFARPKDPAFTTTKEGKNVMTVATATGFGGVNYALQRYFRDLLEKEDLNPDRAALLKNVLTDAYFRGLRNPAEPNDPDPPKKDDKGIALNTGGTPGAGGPGGGAPGAIGGPGGGGSIGPRPGGPGPGPGPGPGVVGPGVVGEGGSGGGSPTAGANPNPAEENPAVVLRKKRARLFLKSQATSWALYYYLASDRPGELRRFLDDLAALPRDLPVDEATVLAAFNRAFGLDGSKAAYARFAQGWLEYIKSIPPVGIDIPLVDPKPAEPMTPGVGPGIGLPGGRPGGPAGRPGGPGGGP